MRFCLDILMNGGSRHLVITPTTSPENIFICRGEKATVAKFAKISVSIVRGVFTQYLDMLDLLDISEDLTAKPTAPCKLLSPVSDLHAWRNAGMGRPVQGNGYPPPAVHCHGRPAGARITFRSC
jgi:hypothetical protein